MDHVQKILSDLRAKRERQYKAYQATNEHIAFILDNVEQTDLEREVEKEEAPTKGASKGDKK